MNRTEAWNHYFNTEDIVPLVKSYCNSISAMAWQMYPTQAEDMFQWGMIGLLKAIKTIDVTRTKSLDSWVWLNVRSMMKNYHKARLNYISFSTPVNENLTLEEILGAEDNTIMSIDLKNALNSARNLDEAKKILEAGGYSPMVRKSESEREKQVARFSAGLISLRGLARELGISKRQAYKLTGGLPATW